ncbi:aldehyde dehydrogenase family protein [Kribbella qitaiheensis]|uniref:aldehyde dehydrogenase family protein n=1 Tax=Kribbella qitaiheensis TaxID=1544730 RepID=UPI001FEA3178|nr:aldehyde dehydrogenase family protein [Kribbella qitaiheensis]
MTTAPTSTDWLAVHRDRLDGALTAIRSRGYYSAFPESPSPRVYGETAAEDGKAAFDAHRGTAYPVETPGANGTVSTEESPFGISLDIQYPRTVEDCLDELLAAAQKGISDWRKGGIETRVGITLEILDRLHKRVFELANAVQHTSGQAFVMAFQAGGAHALDRALEAIAYSYEEMSRYPAQAIWEKPAKGDPIRLEKNFTVVGRGVALVIGCNTFPTWNSWPGLFASLVTGNAVVVKPHPLAVLPLAITVEVCREVLAEAGFDPNLVTLAVEHTGDGLAKPLALRPEVKVIDFTGGSEFGEWLEQNATQAEVFTEKAGVNAVLIDSTDSFKALCNNLAFTLSLYSGQMCTTTQNLFVPGRRDRDRRGAQVLRRGRRRHRELDLQAPRRRRPGGRAARRHREPGRGEPPRAGPGVRAGRAGVPRDQAPGVRGRGGPYAVAGRDRCQGRGRLWARMLRAGLVPGPDRGHRRVDRAVPQDGRRGWRDDRRGLLDGRGEAGAGARRGARGRGGVVGESDRPGFRESVGCFQ